MTHEFVRVNHWSRRSDPYDICIVARVPSGCILPLESSAGLTTGSDIVLLPCPAYRGAAAWYLLCTAILQ